MKRFVLNFGIVMVFSLVPVIVVTMMGDASALFYKSRFYSDLEEGMENDKLIEVQSNHDERIFKKKLIESNRGENFRVVVFGSSRIMLLTSKNSLNLGVSGASLEDILSLYQILKTQNITMDSVLIGVDPWLFYTSDSRWRSISNFYYAYTNESKDEVSYNKALQLVSPSYFQESLKQLTSQGITSPYLFHDSLPLSHSGTLIFPDGHIRYGDNYREADKQTVNSKVDMYLNQSPHYKMNSDIILENQRISMFEEFISHLNSRGIIVSVIFPSYHPRVYNEFVNIYESIGETERIVTDMDNISKYYGSYDPASFKISEDEFYDGMHLKELGMRMLFNKPINISAGGF